jgi:hypothetical protein
MKHFTILIVFALISIQSFSQPPRRSGGTQTTTSVSSEPEELDNKGQWFVFLDRTYVVTLNDVVEIAGKISTMQDGNSYRLQNGQIFYVYCPREWTRLMTNILTKAKGAAITSIADELAKGAIVPWDDNISTPTKNTAVTNCKVWIVNKAYRGGPGVTVLVYNGVPVLKTGKPCLNPQEVDSPTPAQPPVVPKQEVVTIPTGTTSLVLLSYNYNNNSITNSGNSTNTNTSSNENAAANSTGEGTYRVVGQQPYQQPFYPTRQGGFNIGFTLSPGGGRYVQPTRGTYIEPRTGGYGVSGTTSNPNNGGGGGNGGVGADPRTGGHGTGN